MENAEIVNVPKNYATLMVSIIGVCSKRGAFSPEEFNSIGELYEFLKKQLKLEEQQGEQKEQA